MLVNARPVGRTSPHGPLPSHQRLIRQVSG